MAYPMNADHAAREASTEPGLKRAGFEAGLSMFEEPHPHVRKPRARSPITLRLAGIALTVKHVEVRPRAPRVLAASHAGSLRDPESRTPTHRRHA